MVKPSLLGESDNHSSLETTGIDIFKKIVTTSFPSLQPKFPRVEITDLFVNLLPSDSNDFLLKDVIKLIILN